MSSVSRLLLEASLSLCIGIGSLFHLNPIIQDDSELIVGKAREVVSHEKKNILSTCVLRTDDVVVSPKPDPLQDYVERIGYSGYYQTTIELTAYCDCPICSEQWGSLTADGSGTRRGIIAAPQEIPFGTTMIIDGFDMMFTVADRGGAIYRRDDGIDRIDMWVPTHDEAIRVGRTFKSAYVFY